MKHTAKVTLFLLALFICSQVVGLLVTNAYIDVEQSQETGKITFKEVKVGDMVLERPDVEESTSFVFIAIAIIIGTLLVLVLIRFKQAMLWKLWYGLAMVLCLSISFSAFIDSTLAMILAGCIAVCKVFKPNVLLNNLAEVFMYGGLAVIFVPILNLFSVISLLVLISLYDMYAVWKSKHMITLAKFQAQTKIFAGLLVPYKPITLSKKKGKKKGKKVRIAILGGGDMGFPLLFAGVVLKLFGFWYAMVIIPFTTLALAGLFFYGKKDRFYPAMPFVSLGCMVGLGAVYALQMLL